MATGLLGGRYAPEDDQIEPGKLIHRCGGEFIQDRVDAINTSTRTLSLASGKTIHYDWLSLNVGSEVDISGLEPPSDGPRVWPVKPIPPLYELRASLEQASFGIKLPLQMRARRITERGVELESGEEIPCKHVLAAVGLQAKSLTRSLGLAAGPAGLRVNSYMQSLDDQRVFAAGDCADFAPRDLPKLGVFGVKAAGIIHHNLLASLRGKPLKHYKPQRVWLAILNLGDGRGLLLWWKVWWLGRLAYMKSVRCQA